MSTTQVPTAPAHEEEQYDSLVRSTLRELAESEPEHEPTLMDSALRDGAAAWFISG